MAAIDMCYVVRSIAANGRSSLGKRPGLVRPPAVHLDHILSVTGL